MKDWAIENLPPTPMVPAPHRLTAEKHDSLVQPDGQGGVNYNFSGSELVQGEADAQLRRVDSGDLRGPRLHRVGCHSPPSHAGNGATTLVIPALVS
jgi:glutamine synthetase